MEGHSREVLAGQEVVRGIDEDGGADGEQTNDGGAQLVELLGHNGEDEDGDGSELPGHVEPLQPVALRSRTSANHKRVRPQPQRLGRGPEQRCRLRVGLRCQHVCRDAGVGTLHTLLQLGAVWRPLVSVRLEQSACIEARPPRYTACKEQGRRRHRNFVSAWPDDGHQAAPIFMAQQSCG